MGGAFSHPGVYSVTEQWLEHGGATLNTFALLALFFSSPFYSTVCLSLTFAQTKTGKSAFSL